MKTRYWIALLAVILFVCLGASLLLMGGTPSNRAEIISDGTLLKTVDLNIDQEFSVPSPDGGFNTVTVWGGKIAVTDSTCPDHYCMQRGFCNSGAKIVCLPNRLVISFLDTEEIDFVVG